MNHSNVMSLLMACLVAALPCAAVAQSAATPSITPVAQWNRLEFDLDKTAQTAYDKNQTYKKVLLQGTKVDADGNIYATTARWGGPEVPATLSKLVKKDGKWVLQPYPSVAMNRVGDPKALQAVLGIEIDRNGVMWILDQGHVGGKPSQPGSQKLVLWDIKQNKELQSFTFDDSLADSKCSFLNDVVVDNDRDVAYITDSGIFCDPLQGGLIVYDRKTNTARRVLSDTVFTTDQTGFRFRIDNRDVTPDKPMRTGADGIALSGDKKTLYWTNLSSHALYSLDTALLRDPKTSEAALRTAVKNVATLPSNADGMVADRDGNLYLTALELNGILRWDHVTGKFSTVVIHPDMSWPDTIGFGPNGHLYVSSGHLNRFVDTSMDFDHPTSPNFTIWDIGTNSRSYLAK
ncbi:MULTISPECIES: L-dopachrome tautomerase-related protein [Luteibacter]|uniref:L-dopachrome tautomerase-related protein n=1 Tax=Luteibacter TaxID=242605 RepID=UPI000A79CAF2|nr:MULTISPECIES: L-dopachrome tautomerase-related protein [unclassified Luteibacter]